MLAIDLTTTDDFDFSEFVALFPSNTNKSDEFAIDPTGYSKFRFMKECNREKSIGDIEKMECNYYKFLLNSRILQLNSPGWLFRKTPNLKKIVDIVNSTRWKEPVSTVSDIENVVELAPDKTKREKVTWEQAYKLALTALDDAESRRIAFAEEEASRVAIWEESD